MRSLPSWVVSPATIGSSAGSSGLAPRESMTCCRLFTSFCHSVTRAWIELCCCELRNVASLVSLMMEI